MNNKAYVVVYRVDSTLTRPVVFTSREKAEAFIENLKDQYIVNMSKKFNRQVPDSFRDHLKLDIIELNVE